MWHLAVTENRTEIYSIIHVTTLLYALGFLSFPFNPGFPLNPKPGTSITISTKDGRDTAPQIKINHISNQFKIFRLF